MGYAPPNAPGVSPRPLTMRERVYVLLVLAAFVAGAVPLAYGLALFAYGIAY